MILQRPQVTAEMGPDDVDWAEAMASADAGRARDRRGDRPALHPLHLRHHGEAQGRGARQRRLRGGDGLDDAQRLRRRTGRDDLHRVRRRLGRRALLHRVRAADRRRDDDHLRGQARRHAGRRAVLAGRSPSTARKRCSPRPRRSGRSRRRTRRARCWASTTCPHCEYLFLAGERLDPETYHWASDLLGIPVIDHWWQTETGWAIVANPAGHGAAADQAGLAHEADARLGRARRRHLGARRYRPARTARSSSSCRCRPARCRPCGTTTSATCGRT